MSDHCCDKACDHTPARGNFSCDACDRNIPNDATSWSLKSGAPMHCDAKGFCLCNWCGPNPDALTSADVDLTIGDESSFRDAAQTIFRCSSHGNGNDNDDAEQVKHDELEEPCLCRCVVCNEQCGGHDNAEKEWTVGTADALDVTFSFLLCPKCTPPKPLGSVTTWTVSNFFGKCCTPHFENKVIDPDNAIYNRHVYELKVKYFPKCW